LNIFLRIVLLSNLIFGHDLIDFYRENGIQNIEVEAKRLLQSKDYWKNRIKNIDTAFGYYEDLKEIILVDKNHKNLNLYRMGEDEFELLFTEKVITGEKSGWKEYEGDRKTPIGVYRLNDKLKNVNQFYGPMAFVISYPNLYDKSLSRTGSGIWIHGMPMSGERENFTKGCVALSNHLLENLNRKIENYRKILLIIGEDKLPRVPKDDIATILSSLYQWLFSWEKGDFEKYISFYSTNFRLDNSRDFFWFMSYKKRIFDKGEEKEIKIRDVNIAPYPNGEDRNLFFVSFNQSYTSKSLVSNIKKELYIEVFENSIEILFEE
jgi:murein L,D-transpeptidase YafK